LCVCEREREGEDMYVCVCINIEPSRCACAARAWLDVPLDNVVVRECVCGCMYVWPSLCGPVDVCVREREDMYV
jgi:hypothetical protein